MSINLDKLDRYSIYYRKNIKRENKDKYYQYYRHIGYSALELNNDKKRFDLYCQKCWDDFEVVHFNEKTFKPVQYDLLDKSKSIHDKLIERLDNADTTKKDTDDNILRIMYNDGTNNITNSSFKNSWTTLKSSRDITLKYGERADIPLGIAIKTPKKTEVWIVIADGMWDSYGIVQEHALILTHDTSKAEWKLPVLCVKHDLLKLKIEYGTCSHTYSSHEYVSSVKFDPQSILIPKGTTICKFRIIDAVFNNKLKDDEEIEVPVDNTKYDEDKGYPYTVGEGENGGKGKVDVSDYADYEEEQIITEEDEQKELDNMELADDLPTISNANYDDYDGEEEEEIQEELEPVEDVFAD